MRSTLQAYRAWEMEQRNDLAVQSSDLDGIPSHIVSAYQRALEGYNARVHLEEQILRQDMSESENFQQYMIYLKLNGLLETQPGHKFCMNVLLLTSLYQVTSGLIILAIWTKPLREAIVLERFIAGPQRIVPGLGNFGFDICSA